MTRPNTRLLFLIAMIWMALPSNAQTYCRPVSSEEVVAGTSDQGAILDKLECTARFRRFVDETLGEVREAYTPFFAGLGVDPQAIDMLARLIAREQLLSTGWISRSTSVSHEQSASDAKLLQETNTLLREQLKQADFISLQNYKKSLPTREMIRPVMSRLESEGIPPGREQLEHAVKDVQAWTAGLMDRAHEDGGDEIGDCERARAFMNRREAQLLAVLAKSLDEQQASAARAYYRERAEQREKELAAHRARAGDRPCTIREF